MFRASSLVGFVAVLSGVVSLATQEPTQQPSPDRTASAAELSPGTTICVALAKTIDAGKAKGGDAISARVTLPVLAKGKVVLPNDAKVMGHVLSATRALRGAESELAIVFDRAIFKDGSSVPLTLTVQAIGRPATTAQEAANEETTTVPPFTSTRPTTTPQQQPGMIPPPLTREVPTPTPPPPGDISETQHPTLDTASHGAVGLPNLTLTESSDPAKGSVVKATKKNVKLETGMEMILRVVDATTQDKQKG